MVVRAPALPVVTLLSHGCALLDSDCPPPPPSGYPEVIGSPLSLASFVCVPTSACFTPFVIYLARQAREYLFQFFLPCRRLCPAMLPLSSHFPRSPLSCARAGSPSYHFLPAAPLLVQSTVLMFFALIVAPLVINYSKSFVPSELCAHFCFLPGACHLTRSMSFPPLSPHFPPAWVRLFSYTCVPQLFSLFSALSAVETRTWSASTAWSA